MTAVLSTQVQGYKDTASEAEEEDDGSSVVLSSEAFSVEVLPTSVVASAEEVSGTDDDVGALVVASVVVVVVASVVCKAWVTASGGFDGVAIVVDNVCSGCGGSGGCAVPGALVLLPLR